MTAFAAAAYGGVEPGSEVILLLLAGAVGAIALYESMRRGLSRPLALVLCLLGGVAMLCVVQAAPLPRWLVSAISPHRLQEVERLLEASTPWLTLSYDAEATWHALRLIFIAASAFGVVALVCRTTDQVKTLLLGLFVIGVAQACLAIAQQATDAPGIYWGEVDLGGVQSGSFVNHSNFAQFLNLTIAAGLGLLLIRLAEDRKLAERSGQRSAGISEVFRRHGWLLIGLGLQTVAIAASLSRAGMVAMVIAAVVTTMALSRTRALDSRTWTLLVVPPIAFSGMVLLGFGAFYERIDSLQEGASYSDRVELGKATLRAGLDHPWLGAGVGAHAAVFPPYDTTGAVAVAEQADNDYAQLFEEAGLVGVALFAAMALTVLLALRRVASTRRGPIKYAAYGVLYGLVAIAIQSFTDFGQRVPAVFCVTACLAGLVVGLSANRAVRQPTGIAMVRGAIAGAVGLLVWLGLMIAALGDYRAERWWALAYSQEESLRSAGADADPQAYVDLIAAAEIAASIRPANVEYAFWRSVYRWQALEFASQGADPLASAEGRESTSRIADELAETRRLAPTYGPAYTLEGQLRLALGDPAGSRLVREGVRLAPNDPISCFAAASEALSRESETENDRLAREWLRRAVELDGDYFEDAALLALQTREEVVFAQQLAAGQPRRLWRLAELVESSEGLASQAESVRDVALATQVERVEQGEANVYEIADLAQRQFHLGEYERAVDLYRQALALKFDQIKWRLGLIEALVELDRLPEAQREARIAVRLSPGSKLAERKLRSITDRLEEVAR